MNFIYFQQQFYFFPKAYDNVFLQGIKIKCHWIIHSEK